jgi:hypothetical protein
MAPTDCPTDVRPLAGCPDCETLDRHRCWELIFPQKTCPIVREWGSSLRAMSGSRNRV